jgi:hypothetical protein
MPKQEPLLQQVVRVAPPPLEEQAGLVLVLQYMALAVLALLAVLAVRCTEEDWWVIPLVLLRRVHTQKQL